MKTALVTGASKGLGFTWCQQLLQEGYRVILTARKQTQAEEAVRQLQAGADQAFAAALEVTDEENLKTLATWVTSQFGQLDLIVNNAGVNPKDYPDPAERAKAFQLDALNAEAMWRVLHINSVAPLLVVKHFRALLRQSERPVVINISSWLGSVTHLGFGGHYGYVGSKNLLNVLNKSMALELKADGIICVNVNPGWVQSDMGGSKAPFSSAEAVSNLITHVLNRVSLEDTGKFLHFDGSEHPW